MLNEKGTSTIRGRFLLPDLPHTTIKFSHGGLVICGACGYHGRSEKVDRHTLHSGPPIERCPDCFSLNIRHDREAE